MQVFTTRKKAFIKQALTELFIIFALSLTIAKFTQNFKLVLALTLISVIVRSYFYIYRIFLNIKQDNLFYEKPILTYKTIFQHLNFIQRENAFKKRLYLKLLASIRKNLMVLDLPILILNKNADLIWKNYAATKLLSIENATQIKTKLIRKLRNKFKKNKNKTRLKTKSKNMFLELQIIRLNKKAFFITLQDFTFYKKIQKFQMKNMQILQEELNFAIAKNIAIIDSLANVSHITNSNMAILKNNYSDIKNIIEKFGYSLKS